MEAKEAEAHIAAQLLEWQRLLTTPSAARAALTLVRERLLPWLECAAALDAEATPPDPPPPPEASDPSSIAAASVSALLTELGLEPLYGATFDEYSLCSVGQLAALPPCRLDDLLRGLGLTSTHRERVRDLAHSARPCGASGGAWSTAFLSACRPLHAAHMGCENMGPLLYSLARFLKPRQVLEVGAGYTSVWLLQALHDNDHELSRCHTAARQEGYLVGGAEWVLPDVLEERARDMPSVLHCVDNMAHEHTTAHLVTDIAARLGLSDHLQLHEADAYQLAGKLLRRESGTSASAASASTGEVDSSEQLDMLWLDFGVGVGGRLDRFLDAWWPRIRPGGFLLVHSTLGNAMTRKWLENIRSRRSMSKGETPTDDGAGDAIGTNFESISFMEPHKKFQSSVSLFQRRPDGWGEPIHTMYP